MPTLRVTVLVDLDGQPWPGSPYQRRLAVDEAQPFHVEQAAHGDAVTFTTIPAAELATIQALLLTPSRAITLRLDGQTDAGIVVNAGGLVLLLDTTIDAGAGANNAKINNSSGATASLVGGAAGT